MASTRAQSNLLTYPVDLVFVQVCSFSFQMFVIELAREMPWPVAFLAGIKPPTSCSMMRIHSLLLLLRETTATSESIARPLAPNLHSMTVFSPRLSSRSGSSASSSRIYSGCGCGWVHRPVMSVSVWSRSKSTSCVLPGLDLESGMPSCLPQAQLLALDLSVLPFSSLESLPSGLFSSLAHSRGRRHHHCSPSQKTPRCQGAQKI
jgi:hypothetical protein